MKHVMAWLCAVSVLAGVGMTERRAPAAETEAPVLDKAAQAEVRKLQEERRELLRGALEVRVKLYQSARAEMDGVLEGSKRLLATELDMAASDAERIAAYKRQLEMARALIEFAQARKKAARGTEVDVLDAQALALEAEIGLLKAGGKSKKAEK